MKIEHKQIGSKVKLLAGIFMLLAAGCNQLWTAPPASNSGAEEPAVPCEQRGWAEKSTAYQNCSVPTCSYYLQDPYETRGSNDGQINTWDWDNLYAEFFCPAFFIGQTALLPVSAAVNPPWQSQVSRSIFPPQDKPVHELAGSSSGAAQNNKW